MHPWARVPHAPWDQTPHAPLNSLRRVCARPYASACDIRCTVDMTHQNRRWSSCPHTCPPRRPPGLLRSRVPGGELTPALGTVRPTRQLPAQLRRPAQSGHSARAQRQAVTRAGANPGHRQSLRKPRRRPAPRFALPGLPKPCRPSGRALRGAAWSGLPPASSVHRARFGGAAEYLVSVDPHPSSEVALASTCPPSVIRVLVCLPRPCPEDTEQRAPG